MPRGLEHLELDIAELDRVAILHLDALKLGLGATAEMDRGPRLVAEFDVAGDEIGVEVGEKHVLDRITPRLGIGEVLVDIPLRIDNGRRLRCLVGDHV